MKPMTLNLSKMKKVAGDEKSSTFMHPDGHKMVIAHGAVTALQRKQLEKMPVQKFAEGGEADAPAEAAPQQQPLEVEPIAQPAPLEVEPIVQQGPSPASVAPEAAQAQAGAPQDFQGAYNQGQQAITEQQGVDSAKAKAMAGIQQQAVIDSSKLNQDFQQNRNQFMAHQQAVLKDYADGHIDPNRYVHSMGAGQKVATAIGLFLGGFSTPFTHQGNPALEMLNKQIERDMEAQRAELDKRKNLLGANQAMFHDQLIAQNQTRVNLNDIYDHKVQLEAAKLGTPQAKAAADMAHAKFAMENNGLLQQNAIRKTLNDANGSGGTIGADPSRFVPFVVPKEHQAKAFSEIEAAQNTQQMRGSIIKAFDEAASDNTALKTGFGHLRTPGSVFALHQAMQPTFKDLEGTVRQAAMDNTFKNITPAPGDADSTIQTKRAALEDYLKSKMSAPTAKAYGIDLQKFQSTRSPEPGEGQVKTMGGVPYQKVPGGWKRVQ